MIKKLIKNSILLFIGLFILSMNNVYASNWDYNWTDTYVKLKEYLDSNPENKTKFEYLIKKLNELDKKYIITFGISGKFYPFKIIFTKENLEFGYDYSKNQYTEVVKTANNGSSAIGEDLYYIEDLNELKIDDWVGRIKNNFNKIVSRYDGIPFYSFPNNNINNNIVLYSNFGNFFQIKNIPENENIYINEDMFIDGLVPTFDTYYQYFKIDTGDKEYIYNKNVNLADYSKLEWLYNVNGNLVFDLQFEATIEDWNSLGSPYIDIEGNDGKNYKMALFEEGFIPTEGGFVRGTKHIDLLNVKSMKITWDTTNSYSTANIKIKTNYSIKENFIPKNTSGNFIKIAMNNNYGIYLIPKTKGISNFSTIYLKGLYDIENRNYEFPDKDKDYTIIDKKIDYSSSIYQYLTYFDELNFVTFIVNKNYGKENPNNEEYYVQFDSNMYSYAIKETPNSEVSIENPNTGEKIDFPIDDNIQENKNIEDYLNDTRNFLKNIQKYNKEFLSLFQYLFNSFNNTIKTAIIGLFIVFIVCSIILIARGKK